MICPVTYTLFRWISKSKFCCHSWWLMTVRGMVPVVRVCWDMLNGLKHNWFLQYSLCPWQGNVCTYQTETEGRGSVQWERTAQHRQGPELYLSPVPGNEKRLGRRKPDTRAHPKHLLSGGWGRNKCEGSLSYVQILKLSWAMHLDPSYLQKQTKSKLGKLKWLNFSVYWLIYFICLIRKIKNFPLWWHSYQFLMLTQIINKNFSVYHYIVTLF